MLVAALGNAIATGTTNIGARFFAMFLMPMGAVSACKCNPTLPAFLPPQESGRILQFRERRGI